MKKNISHVLLPDHILLPDFEKLDKIHKKIPVKFLRTPVLWNICKQLLLSQLGSRYIFSLLKSVYRTSKSMKIIWGWLLNVSTSYLYLWRTVLHNKLQIWEIKAHQSERLPQKYLIFIFHVLFKYFMFYFLIFFFWCGNSKFRLSVFRQTNLMK